MSNMGRCTVHGCAFTVSLTDGKRREYCPECEIDSLRQQLAAERERRCGTCADWDRASAYRDGNLDEWAPCISDESLCHLDDYLPRQGMGWRSDHGCPHWREKETP